MKKVLVGISGGVDSAVSALLLKKQGYDVYAVTFVMYKNEDGTFSNEVASSINDATAICKQLSIPFYTLDCSKEFKTEIIDYFAHEYIAGRTPNPCVICNRKVKFNKLLEYAKSIGAEYIATGHYARVAYDENTQRYFLKNASYDKKDQTYALFNLTQEELSHLILPLGELSKDEVRKIAEENGLIVAKKSDSQEVCFIPSNDYASYICEKYNYTPTPGDFVYEQKVIGRHKGIIHYTVGQRRGLGLSLKAPLYVKALDSENNRVILSSCEELFAKSLTCTNVNWMATQGIAEPTKLDVKIRYSAKKQKATITPLSSNSVYVVFDSPVRGITKGQAAVFYSENDLVGGGIIS